MKPAKKVSIWNDDLPIDMIEDDMKLAWEDILMMTLVVTALIGIGFVLGRLWS